MAMATNTTSTDSGGGAGGAGCNDGDGGTRSYVAAYVSPSVRTRMEAGAFDRLCVHLRERSDEVQNMDLMTLSGFCRNCLAKWMVVEARRISDDIRAGKFSVVDGGRMGASAVRTARILDALGYDEAAEWVYGCTYPEWKERHQKKATEEQMRRYKESAPLQARHDKSLLQPRGGVPSDIAETDAPPRRYVELHVPPPVRTELEAGAFRSLCRHLRERSDEVQNMDLMTLSGFCRNCLAKWLVVEARAISDSMTTDAGGDSGGSGSAAAAAAAAQKHILDALGYDEAAEYVYDCTYPKWKRRHQKKATEAQMEAYNASAPLHARHDKALLQPRADKSDVQSKHAAQAPPADTGGSAAHRGKTPLLSDVCCQDVESATSTVAPQQPRPPSDGAYAPVPPPSGGVELRVGILTVSDRAAANQYECGDLSGPAVEAALKSEVDRVNDGAAATVVALTIVQRSIVPDDPDAIAAHLKRWSSAGGDPSSSTGQPRQQKDRCNLILTTGGTGFAPRDVTPEATVRVLDRECRGLMSWVSAVSSRVQPLASLSRGTAGVCGGSIVVNLPGSPKGADQVTRLLLPLLLHAVKDLEQ